MSSHSIFPLQTSDYLLSFQFSSWYPTFSSISIKSTIIRPLSQAFKEYLDSDGIFVPEGSENVPAESPPSDQEDEDDAAVGQSFSFPDLDERIRQIIKEYGAIFPKLNFSSPKDASWILPPSSPLKCTSPSDVYILLKSSDFISHDLSIDAVFEGCQYDPSNPPSYQLELVLRKWYPVDRSREFRCFVCEDRLIGISQRDTNFYDFMNEPQTQSKILETLWHFWEDKIKSKWHGQQDYVFDVLMTRDLSRGHVLDFNPYAPRTDPLLFTYEELLSIFTQGLSTPELRIIDSPLHPVASRNAPAYQHNMLPMEALALSSGRDIDDFSDLWKNEIQQSMNDDD
ncbi:D123-domain-containing protein [Suillus fuscotomentosus]|uniref:D123-domain-containing protein n=1 Tax=Suillus fuscotomentosus TaxID=1912939 RepID=A0AAD4HIU8_9AGAM|nr:D123-domain-containing protein [Suillus fuscotomentosus]KAG1898122.1 D123-domain-containing protein [Suillus fuscotomentosus]